MILTEERPAAALAQDSVSPDPLRPETLLKLRIQAIRYEAEAIRSFELRAPDGGALPGFTAGAHIDLKLPGDLRRSYSLINGPAETDRYLIAVNRDAASRGGSAFLCETARAGDIVEVVAPLNTFALHETSAPAVLIGGGIGITPLLSMVLALEAFGRPWRLHYVARTRAQAAFVPIFEALERERPGRVTISFDQGPGGRMLDLAAIVAAEPAGSHFYCCGPIGMLNAFDAATEKLHGDNIHKEYFSSDLAPAKGGFEVTLAKSGKTLWIPAGKTILQALLDEDMPVARSCMEGVCGTCETEVLEGIPDHRDHVLSKRERASNRKMMICCSGALSEKLVLDL